MGIALMSMSLHLPAQEAAKKEVVDAQKEQRMEWFSQAKLGVFIHWGIYSVKGDRKSVV